MRIQDVILPADLKEKYEQLCRIYRVVGLKGLQSIKPEVEKQIAHWKRRKALYHDARNSSGSDFDDTGLEQWNVAEKLFRQAEAKYWIYRTQLDTIEDFEEWYKTHRMAQDV